MLESLGKGGGSDQARPISTKPLLKTERHGLNPSHRLCALHSPTSKLRNRGLLVLAVIRILHRPLLRGDTARNALLPVDMRLPGPEVFPFLHQLLCPCLDLI